MNDAQFKKGIEDLKNISLSQSEKQKMLSEITAYADFHAPKMLPKKSAAVWSWSFFQSHSALALRALTLVLIVGGTSYMAEKSLPGDILYPFKVNINEPVYSSLLKTPEEKAAWNSDTFIRRIEEAEALARTGKLTESSLAEIERQIDSSFIKIQGEGAVSDMSVSDSARMANGQAKFAAPAPEATTMMMQANVQVELFATTTEKGELEQKIGEHKEILETLLTKEADEQNVLIRRLQMKLDEKALLRAQMQNR